MAKLFFFNTPSVVIVSQREGVSRGALSDKESPESAPEQFSLQATGQGYFSFALSLLQGFLTLAHPYALPPLPFPLSTHMCVLSFLLLTNLGYCMLFFALCISSPFS